MEITLEYCPCGSGQQFKTCCAPYLSGESSPDTPIALMRARYTAYTKCQLDYIQKTMKPPAADEFNFTDSLAWAKESEWHGLEILHSSQNEDLGTVEFIAQFTQDNKRHVLHEISQFRRDQGKWYYIDGNAPTVQKKPVHVERIGRNDPCKCGSGKKYKKCCGI